MGLVPAEISENVLCDENIIKRMQEIRDGCFSVGNIERLGDGEREEIDCLVLDLANDRDFCDRCENAGFGFGYTNPNSSVIRRGVASFYYSNGSEVGSENFVG